MVNNWLLILVAGLCVGVRSYVYPKVNLCLCAKNNVLVGTFAEEHGTGANDNFDCFMVSGIFHNDRFLAISKENVVELDAGEFITFPPETCKDIDNFNKRFLIPGVADINLDHGVKIDTAVGGVGINVGKDGVGVSGHVNAGPLGSVGGNINVDGSGKVSGGANAEVHAGVVDAKANVDVDNGGHVSGGVGGHVNVEGVEVGGNVNVDKGGHVSGGASLGVGLGSLGGVDVHVNAGPDGVKTGVGAHVDAGPLHGSASVDVDQHGHVSGDASGTVGVGPVSVSGNAHVDQNGASVSGKADVGGHSIGGNVNVDKGGQVTGGLNANVNLGGLGNVQGNANFGPGGQVTGGVSGSSNLGGLGNVQGNLNVGPGGQVSGGASGNVDIGNLGSVGGNVNVGTDGHVSGGVSGTANLGNLGSVSGNLNVGAGGQTSGSFSGNLGGMPFNIGLGGSSGSGSGSGNDGSGGMSTGGSGSGSGSGSQMAGMGSAGMPNFFNPASLMSSLVSGGQSGTGYNPVSFFQQAGVDTFLQMMRQNGKRRHS